MSRHHVYDVGALPASSMPSSHPPTTGLSGFATELRTIATDLEHGAHLLQQGPNADVVGDMRSRLSRAGRLLMHLMLKAIVAPPSTTTTWLQWRTPGTRRPRFSGLRYKGDWQSVWKPAKRLRDVALSTQIYQPARKTGTPRTFFETPAATLDRLVFAEAVAGWLGNRCAPRVRCRLPVCEVQLAGHGADDGWISAPLDQAATPERERLLFLELCRAAGTVCRYLASLSDSYRQAQDAFNTSLSLPPELPASSVQDGFHLDDAVERAYDLLRHYHDLLRPPHLLEPRAAERQAEKDGSLDQLEPMMRQWLPLALPSRDPLLVQVHEVIGDRTAARDLLHGADLHATKLATLNRLAGAAANKTTTLRDAIVGCRTALHRWRGLQPTVRKAHDGRLVIVENLLHKGISTGLYWSSDLTQRPAFIGSALGLAAFCKHVAEIAAAAGVQVSDLRSALHLAHSLNCTPHPTSLADPDYATVVDRQASLATEVDLLLNELALIKPITADAVDWETHRSRISARGDTEGLALLGDLLKKQAVGSRITDVSILNILSRHEHERSIYQNLQPDLDLDASSPTAACQRWRKLSKWADIFSTERGGVQRIHWGYANQEHGPVSVEQIAPRGTGRQPPELAWARAWRHATGAIVQLAVQHGVEDKPLHRLIQVIDSVLAGTDTPVGEAVRDAELACGAVEARLPFASDQVESHGVTGDDRPPTPEPPRLDDPTHGLGHGGPARTLTAAGQVILVGRTPGSALAAGDETTLKAVAARMPENVAKKARDYLAPSGKLVQGGWIERDGLRVIFTAKGAEAAMRRIRRDDESRRPR